MVTISLGGKATQYWDQSATWAMYELVSWSLMSLFSTNTAISETTLCMRSTHSRVDNKITRELRELHLSSLVGRSHWSNLINPLILWVVVNHKLFNKAVKRLDLIAVWHSGRFTAATHWRSILSTESAPPDKPKTDVTPATKSRDFDAQQGVAHQSRKCDRACRTLHHGASHSCATRFWNRALFYSVRLWRASESRVKGVTSVL